MNNNGDRKVIRSHKEVAQSWLAMKVRLVRASPCKRWSMYEFRVNDNLRIALEFKRGVSLRLSAV